MTDRIQALRRERGWSQTELARRAGVTRQLVGAVESGRHLPNVSAALALANALQTSVEQLFGADGDPAADVLGAPAAAGVPVRAARVGERLVSVPVTRGVDSPEAWGLADAITAGAVTAGDHTLGWLPGGSVAELLIAGCDPILGMLAALAERAGSRMLVVHASTGQALTALAAGRAHGVLVHARPGELPAAPVPVRRWHVASWQVGLAAAPSKRTAPSIDELAARRLKVVQRDPGAGTQRALVRALREAGADTPLPGPIGDGHIDVARRVSYGAAAAGVLMEAASIAFGLRFTALEQHTVELWIAEEWAGLPAARGLLEALCSDALLARSRLLGGYDTTGCGSEVQAG